MPLVKVKKKYKGFVKGQEFVIGKEQRAYALVEKGVEDGAFVVVDEDE